MSSDFWMSTHRAEWLFTPELVDQAKQMHLAKVSRDELQQFDNFLVDVVEKIAAAFDVGKSKRGLHRRVISTAIVYVKRFYLRNEYCGTDPLLVCVTSLYLATKVEEFGLSRIEKFSDTVKSVMASHFPNIPCKISAVQIQQCEFFLLEQINSSLVVFHAHRSFNALTDASTGDLLLSGVFNEEQLAWVRRVGSDICNDALRTDLPLIHPPFVIALGAAYLAALIKSQSAKGYMDNIGPWLASLSVDLHDIISVVHSLLNHYSAQKLFQKESLPNIAKRLRGL